jgi:hypothetical protein
MVSLARIPRLFASPMRQSQACLSVPLFDFLCFRLNAAADVTPGQHLRSGITRSSGALQGNRMFALLVYLTPSVSRTVVECNHGFANLCFPSSRACHNIQAPSVIEKSKSISHRRPHRFAQNRSPMRQVSRMENQTLGEGCEYTTRSSSEDIRFLALRSFHDLSPFHHQLSTSTSESISLD